ncbi:MULTISPECIES: long-chain-fatty-acid--CoA ligase [Pseudomonas]|uniref:Long-chain-fatty-acid--CoA ligase n=1 Tax=Pseudomonas quercus TaxID=2722792 RepID=A0ABX0Y9M0_9PSED|nr:MULTISPECIES: long-chain-fatty-acid--CoA ligase [Pseudomonas]MBF7141492.1 long-chain-fatty-acid--CoA ligase [Pseudomonas sp. LY10J]NJP00031.1 long-chain-fatty-acid--CoA ligase [Pseudomonas quercus]
MQPDFWADKRPAGLPATLDFTTWASVVEVFQHACGAFADKPAYSNLGRTLTYGQLKCEAEAFAAWLQRHTDLVPGDRIAVQLPNVLQYPVAVFGALCAGLIVVNTNPLYTTREMRHQFKDSGARALVYLNLFGDRVQQVVADTPMDYLIEAKMGDLLSPAQGWLVNLAVARLKKQVPHYHLPQAIGYTQALKLGRKGAVTPVALCREDTAVLQYTGGTTGVAKGAMLTHGNLLANMQQVQACFSQSGADGQPLVREGQETAIAPLPLYHIYAFTAHCLCLMVTGNHNVLITNPRDIPAFIKVLGRWRFTSFVGLNTLFVALMDHPGFARLDLSALKVTNSGGTALVKATAQRWEALTGCRITEGYGLTETSPVVCTNPYGSGARLGTVGLPVVGTALKVIDEQGQALPLGEAGELCVRGPQVMKGYWQRPEETAQTLDGEGWLKTGDIAIIDPDGFVRIVDRKKDMIIVSGFNVYPNEVEEVVMAHPEVLNCAAIGVPDERTGEAIRLFVVPRAKGLEVAALSHWCRDNLAPYKVPRQVVIRDALPMTPVGKILRRALREEAYASEGHAEKNCQV